MTCSADRGSGGIYWADKYNAPGILQSLPNDEAVLRAVLCAIRLSYQLSSRLVIALRRSRSTLTELGAPVGLTQPRISAYCAGRRFGSRVRERIVQIGSVLRIPDEACTKRSDR